MKTPAHGKRLVRHAAVEAMEPRLLMSGVGFTLTDLAPFTTSVGHQSAAGLVRDASGNLYGTTTLGGTNNLGTVFKVANGSGAVTTVASFSATSGCYPTADLVMDSSGNLYGTTPYGGASGVGTVYEITSGSSAVTRLASFTSAANDVASVKLVVDSHGNLYGTTPFGGNNSAGSIFEIVSGSGTITTLASFSTGTGDDPSSGLVRDSAGNLYGTTPRDGPDGHGSIYELPFNTSSITVLAPFTYANAPEQASGLTMDASGDLFGTTQFGGTGGYGSVYELPAGGSTINTLASFNSSNGANPSSPPVLDSSGDLLGTTPNGGPHEYGTVWEILAGTNSITTVIAFTGTNGSAGTDGFSQNAIMPDLVGDGHGNFYGVAPSGAPGGLGAVYSLTPQKATQIVVAQQPTGTITSGTPQAVTLDMDTVGNVIDPTNQATVNLSILSGPTGGTLTGTTTIAAANGVANLSGVVFNLAGVYTLTATATGLTPAILTPVTVTGGAAATLVISQQPIGAGAGQSLGTTIVEVEDGHGNIVTGDSSTVNIAASGGASLIGTTSAQAVAGVATFTGLAIGKVGTYTLTLSDGSLTSANTSSFAVTAGTASQLAVVMQPSATATAGQSIGTVKVDVDDAFGNLISNNTASISVSAGGTPLTGTATKAAVAGMATFTGLAIDKSGSYTLAVSASGLGGTNTSSFTINPAAATQLMVIQQPQASTAAGQNIGTVMVGFADAFGNAVTNNSSTVKVATTTGSPLVGTATAAAAAGVATFSNLTLSAPGTYTLTISDGRLTGATTASFVVTAAAASQLVITQQPPGSTAAGQTIAAVNVAVEDPFGNVVTSDSSSVSVSISGASLLGTTTQTAQNGVATFADLSITTAGVYNLTVTDGSLTTAISSSFNIVAGASTQLLATEEPSTGTAGESIGAVQIQLEDAYGNIATADTSGVTISADTASVLTGTTTQTPQNGVATFDDLSFSTAGTYTLTASDGTLKPATLDPITIAAGADPTPTPKPHPKPKPKPAPKPAPHPTPTPLPLQPITAIANALLPKIVIDSNTDFGLTSDSSKSLTVTFDAISSTGTVIPAHKFHVANGYSTISNLRIRIAGDYTMVIADALGNTVTDQVTILPAKPVKLEFVTEPASVDGSTPVQVQAVDAYGNLTSSADGTRVSLRFAAFPLLGRNPKLSGTTAATLVNGIATFPDVSVNRKGRARLVASALKLRSIVSAIFVNQ